MIRFVHTADIHFGMENYGRIDPKTGIHSRLLDFYYALNSIVDYAINEQVDFFLFAGDAYKTAHPSPTQQQLLFECFLRLFKAEIPIIIIVGNHDNPLSFGKAHALELFGQLPVNGFYVIAKPTSFTITTRNGPINIVGIPWPSRSTVALHGAHAFNSAADLAGYISRATAAIIEDFAKKLDPHIPAVLTGHLTVSSGIFSGSEKHALYGTDPVLMPSQLAIQPFDYVALGHLHRHQNLNQGGIPVVYAGSIERVDFGERNEEKGFYSVAIHDKNTTTYEFIKTPTRRLIQLDIQLEGTESQTDQIIAALETNHIEEAIIKIIYHVPPGKRDLVDIAELQQYCSRAQHLVGVFPIRSREISEKRLLLHVNKPLHELLDNYFKTKPELDERRSALLDKALLLDQELREESENC